MSVKRLNICQGKKFQPDPYQQSQLSMVQPYPMSLYYQSPMGTFQFSNGIARIMPSTIFGEKGAIVKCRHSYGFIQIWNSTDASIFFHYSEYNGNISTMKVGDPVEFRRSTDHTGRPIAVQVTCIVETQAVPSFPSYTLNSRVQTIPSSLKDLKEAGQVPTDGDKIDFQTGQQKANGKTYELNKLGLFLRPIGRCRGYVCFLHQRYGFIENDKHDQETFFSFNELVGNASNDLDLGDEVEYTLGYKHSKQYAHTICKLPKGNVGPEEVIQYAKGTLQGKVLRAMRIVDREQDEYCGLVQVGTEVEEGEKAETYPYSITSLADKRDFLQKGDIVSFQLAMVKGTNVLRAANLVAQREFIRATVERFSGAFGSLNYEVEGKNLFFHMMQVHNSEEILPGDEVEFTVVQKRHSGKYAACSVRKISENQRPEKLDTRTRKTSMNEDALQLVMIRRPRGPDGTKGFKTVRAPWRPATS